MLLTTITTDPETITEDISEVKSVLSGIDLYKVLSTVILAVICIVAVKVLLHPVSYTHLTLPTNSRV